MYGRFRENIANNSKIVPLDILCSLTSCLFEDNVSLLFNLLFPHYQSIQTELLRKHLVFNQIIRRMCSFPVV